MLTLTSSATYVALVQTAASLPVVLFAVLAGAIGDLVDRRRFLLVTQAFMLAAAAALGVLALAGLVTPWVLLALIFAVGTGQALTSPTWQTLQPELVSPAERPQAISLGAVNQNLARAVGPAIGGALLAATSAGTVFLVNAATLRRGHRGHRRLAVGRPRPGALPREHVGEAIRAGGRYVAASPVLRVILVRAGAVHLLRQRHLGAAAADRAVRSCTWAPAATACCWAASASARWPAPPCCRGCAPGCPRAPAGAGSLGLAVVTLCWPAHVTAVVAVALAVGGACWILALSTLNSLYQLSLPGWVKARGMSFYLIVFQGGNAVGSAVMGVAASTPGCRRR